MLVCESLDRFMLLNEEFLAENILNEKFDINLLSDYHKKLAVLASMFFMFASGKAPDKREYFPNKEDLVKNPIMTNMAEEGYLSRDEIFTNFWDIIDSYATEEPDTKRILSMSTDGLIDSINAVKPGRFDTAKIAQYDQYDEDILMGIDKLKAAGESPNADLIKTIMLIETGMKPSKNSLGYEGFPQTNKKVLAGINRKNNTNFTMEDMYNPERATEYIHYYLKSLEWSDHIENDEDKLIAYNWGIGNLIEYKKGNKKLPKQSGDYIKMYNVMKPYFS